jgi:hypothetical protein
MRVGENSSISSDFSNNASSMTVDEQIIKELSVPVQKGDYQAANARRDKVKEIFENLPPDEAKALYDRLQKYNWKDNVNDQFHGTFEDYSLNILKNTLKSRFEPQNGGTTSTSGTPQTGAAIGAEKKADVGNAAKATQDKLNEELFAKDSNAPAKIAGRKDMNDFDKQTAIDQWMRNASPDVFQKMIKQSSSWPKDTQKLMFEAFEHGANGISKHRLVSDLKPDQQIDMLKRLTAGGYRYSANDLTAGLDKTTLNQVAKDFKNFPGFELDPDKNIASANMVHMIALRAKDLTPENQRALADTILRDGMPQEPMQSWRAFLTSDLFDSLKGPENEQQARDLFAHIQQNGDLKNMLGNFKDQPMNFKHDFLGLGKNELQAITQTFVELANEAPLGSQLQQIYLESARSAAEWSF